MNQVLNLSDERSHHLGRFQELETCPSSNGTDKSDWSEPCRRLLLLLDWMQRCHRRTNCGIACTPEAARHQRAGFMVHRLTNSVISRQ
jgi:hypothetical protein